MPMSSCVLRSISVVLQEPARFGDSATTSIAGTHLSLGDLAFAPMMNNFATE
jgi:glutathione S-transferase